MFCRNCGNQVDENKKFCTKCGAMQEITSAAKSPEKDTEKPPKPPKKKKAWLVVLIIIIVIALGVGGAFGFFALKKFFDPAKKVLEAIVSGDYKTAHELYDELEEVDDSFIDELIARVDSRYTEYFNKTITYDAVVHELNGISEMDISVDRLNDKINEVYDKSTKLNASRTAYETAIEFHNNLDYENAVDYYRQVITEDPEYQTANTKQNEALASLKTQILDGAKAYADTGDYETAISYLAKGDRLLANDSEIAKQKALYTAKIKETTLNTALNKAAEQASEKNYVKAIETLEAAVSVMGEDSQLTAKIKEYTTAYVNSVITEADKYVKNKKYDEAISVINAALVDVPDNSILTNKKSEINDKKPASFIEVCEPYDKCVDTYTSYKDGSVFFMAGIARTNGFVLRDVWSDNDDSIAYVASNLSGKYKSLEFKVGRVDGSANTDATVKILVDGKLKKTVTIKADDLPHNITVDTKGGNQIKFEISFSTVNGDNKLGFADMLLYK